MKDGLMNQVSEDNCDLTTKPESKKECKREPCSSEWFTSEWSHVCKFFHGHYFLYSTAYNIIYFLDSPTHSQQRLMRNRIQEYDSNTIEIHKS